MKKITLYATVGILFVACASAPATKAPVADAPASTEKAAADNEIAPPVKKEPKIIVVRVPVEQKSSTFFADGTLDEYTQSDYDEAWALKKQSRFTASGSLIESVEYTYKDGLLSAKSTKNSEGTLTTARTYIYDGKGLLIRESLTDGAGKSLSTFEYGYDSAGNKTSWIVKDSKGTVAAETVYTYKDGKVRAAELRDSGGKKTGASTYEYDTDGNRVKQNFYDALGSLIRVEKTTWKDGKIAVEERMTPGGVVQLRTSYEYGSSGELVKKTVDDIRGKAKQSIEYQYTFREERRTENG